MNIQRRTKVKKIIEVLKSVGVILLALFVCFGVFAAASNSVRERNATSLRDGDRVTIKIIRNGDIEAIYLVTANRKYLIRILSTEE